ncbi:MAG: plasmid pRiA4b ORF-3 family protein [Prevotella sp.]|nr:plasmid pRiA4b ORF-3 family protein [Prevotella sp.]
MKELKEMFDNVSEEDRNEILRALVDETSLAVMENKCLYSYQKPDYKSKAIQEIRWLGPFWNAEEDDDKVALCESVENDIRKQGVTPEAIKEEMRGYLYHVFANFKPGNHENHLRLFGPLWMMEKLQMTDCLDLVLEALRQDAFFYHNYFLGFTEWVSAVIYQLGRNQIDTLERFMYERSIIPSTKGIVFNSLVWIYVRHPEERLYITGIILKYLNHYLNICKRGALTTNTESYAMACATAKIKETLPVLRRLFTELDVSTEVIVDGYDEVEYVMNKKKGHFCCLYDNINDYLHDGKELHELEYADWRAFRKEEMNEKEDGLLNSNDDETIFGNGSRYSDEDYIYDEGEKAKRYIIRIELTDGPEKVVRTLQVPSNIFLTPFTELLMLSFGRQDVPEIYEYNNGVKRYRPDIEEFVNDKEYWEMDDSYYSTLSDLLRKKGNTATFTIMKGDKAIWHHLLTLEKIGRYTEKIEHRIELIDGQGCYPIKSVKNMDELTARYNAGKLKQPNLDTIRKRIRNFEEEYEEKNLKR